MQGTGAITLAALLTALRVTGIPMREQRLLVFGAGTAGVGIADQIRDAMVRDGASPQQAKSQVWLVDKQGLLTSDLPDLRDYQRPYARDPQEVKGWADGHGGIYLPEAVRQVKPTVLVTAGMLLAAAEAVAGQVDVGAPGAPLVPPVQNLRASSATTAVAVAEAAVADGVATVQAGNWVQAVQDAMWQPVYEGGA